MASTTRGIGIVALFVGCGVIAGVSRESQAQAQARTIDWSTNATGDGEQTGKQVSFICPSTSTSTTMTGGVWGTDVYTDDSKVCPAAVQAGVITTAGGPVTIEYWPALAQYEGSTRNGVPSNGWSWVSGEGTNASFIFPKGLPVGEQVITFDNLGTGPVSTAAVASGVTLVPEKGTAQIYDLGAGMVAPGHAHVLVMSGDPETRLTIRFGAPIRKLSVTRAGTSGASNPTWRLVAYNSLGTQIGTLGEAHGAPPQAQEYSMEAYGIDHATLVSDTRLGTESQWSSVPIVQFRIER